LHFRIAIPNLAVIQAILLAPPWFARQGCRGFYDKLEAAPESRRRRDEERRRLGEIMDTGTAEQGGESSGCEPADRMNTVEASRSLKKDGDLGPNVQAFTSLFLMVLLGSFTAAAAKVAVRDLPVALVPIVRFGFAGLCLIPLVWGKGTLKRLVREDGRLLILAAALFVPINQGFFLNASRYAPTTHVAVFYAAAPLVVLILSCALGHERFLRGRLWGMLASVLGVSVIALGDFWGPSVPVATSSSSNSVLWGDLLLIGAVASWGGYVTLSKPLVARHGVLPVLVGTFLLGTLLDLPVAIATHSGWPGFAGISSASWIALALLACVITPLGQIFQNHSLSRLDASQVATFSNGSPVLTVVWGVWFFEEAVTVALTIGGLLTLGGIYWSTKSGNGRSARIGPTPSEAGLIENRLSFPLVGREPIHGLTSPRPCRSA